MLNYEQTWPKRMRTYTFLDLGRLWLCSHCQFLRA
jgi:hypothetical protein